MRSMAWISSRSFMTSRSVRGGIDGRGWKVLRLQQPVDRLFEVLERADVQSAIIGVKLHEVGAGQWRILGGEDGELVPEGLAMRQHHVHQLCDIHQAHPRSRGL